MKLVRIGLVLLIIVGGAYFFSNRDKSYSVQFTELASTTGQLLRRAASAITQAISSHSSSTVQTASRFVASTTQQVEDAVGQAVKDAVAKKAAEVGSGLIGSPISIGSNDQAVSFSIKTGSRAYFTLHNANTTEEMTYIVDWQDSVRDEGTLAKGESRIVSHVWTAPGTFKVLFSLKEKKLFSSQDTHQIIVSVFE